MKEGEPKPEEEKQEPERTSGLMRVAGVSKEKEKEILEEIKTEVFDKQKLLGKEREKTPEEIEIVEGILTNLPQFIKRYGGKAFPIKPEHIHVLDYGELTDEEKKALGDIKGRYATESQMAVVIVDPKEENKLTFALRTAHELLHFSSFQSVSLIDEETKSLVERIGGFCIRTEEDGEKEIYFTDLDEAITEELKKRFAEEYFKLIPSLAEDVAHRDKFKRGDKDRDEIANIIHTKEDSGAYKGMYKSTIETYRFNEERKKLWEIIEQIQQKNPQQFKLKEEVFDVFAETYFTGHLLKVARLIERTYGKGSFRKLGRETKAKKQKLKNKII